MPNANLKSVFNGLSLGTVPLACSAYVQTLVEDLFPQHHLTLVHRGEDIQLLIYPRLTKDEQERWEEALEDLFRELNMEDY